MFNNLTPNNFINTPDSRPNDGYHEFETVVRERLANLVDRTTPMYKADINREDLWEAYLSGFDSEAARSHYNCNACRMFIVRYGSLVVLNDNAKTISVFWNEEEVPAFFKKSVKAMRLLVENASIKTVFIGDPSEDRIMGMPKTGEWTHLSATLLPDYKYINRDRLLTANQVMAKKKEDYGMLSRALAEYTMDTINKTMAFVESETLYRGDKCLERLKWFKELKETHSKFRGEAKKNVVWLAVAIAPEGFCAVRSSMIGTLLDDIQEGLLSYDSIKRRYDEKMDPSKYMRSQNDPTVNQLYEAEKTVAKLGIANSLQRRYASINELPEKAFIWQPKAVKKTAKKDVVQGASVFGHLKARDTKDTSTLDSSNLPTTVMTWDKFQRTVLPTAQSLEVLVDNPNRLMALVTAADSTAENILQWDNTFSWYYHGGIDAEMKKRVEQFGGRYENNIMRCSLMWEGYTDLDLHCINPEGRHMYYGRDSRKDSYGGYLDLDMNGIDKRSNHPVENIRWANRAPEGHYKFYVHNFNERENKDGTPFKVELEVNGIVYSYEGEALRDGAKVTVFEFDYHNGNVVNMKTAPSGSRVSSAIDWGINANTFVKVNSIVKSPNLWEERAVPGAGNHTFFLLDKCRDMSEGLGRGFFNEMLKSDLRSIRKVLEAYTAQTPIADVDTADAFGVGFSKDNPWNLTLRVKTDTSTRLIKIDRFD